MNEIFITTTSTAVATTTQIPLNVILRRTGSITANNNGVVLLRPGYYEVDGTVTLQATAGLIDIAVLKNGVEVPAISTQATAEATTTYTLPITGVIRVMCHEGQPLITLYNKGTPITISNLALRIKG